MEKINWFQQAEKDAKNIVEDAKKWLKDNTSEDLLLRFEKDENSEPFCLDKTLNERGYFEVDNIRNAIDCICQLENQEETDLALWEGHYSEQEVSDWALSTYKNVLREKIKENLQN
jgi:hypothetical protein